MRFAGFYFRSNFVLQTPLSLCAFWQSSSYFGHLVLFIYFIYLFLVYPGKSIQWEKLTDLPWIPANNNLQKWTSVSHKKWIWSVIFLIFSIIFQEHNSFSNPFIRGKRSGELVINICWILCGVISRPLLQAFDASRFPWCRIFSNFPRTLKCSWKA